jgi:hypothetical protein
MRRSAICIMVTFSETSQVFMTDYIKVSQALCHSLSASAGGVCRLAVLQLRQLFGILASTWPLAICCAAHSGHAQQHRLCIMRFLNTTARYR